MWTDIQTEVQMNRQVGMMKITGVFTTIHDCT
jgi:hypothetical protein